MLSCAKIPLVRKAVIAFVTTSLLAGVVVAVTYLLVDRYATRDESRPADAILVLGSAVWPGGEPSPSLRARTERAIALYRSGVASHLILSGGLGRIPPPEAEVMRRLVLAADIPESALVVDDQSGSTLESVSRAAPIMRERGWHILLIVSDPFHLLRAVTMARDTGIKAYGVPALESPTHTIPHLRFYYTLREAFALLWYIVAQRPFMR